MKRDRELNSLRKKIRDYEQVSVGVWVCAVRNKLAVIFLLYCHRVLLDLVRLWRL